MKQIKPRHVGLYYQVSPDYEIGTTLRDWFADNFEEGVVPEGRNLDVVKTRKPGFLGYNYKSCTDNYTQDDHGNPPKIHPDEVKFEAICASLGIDVEDCYLHWEDETTTFYLDMNGVMQTATYPGYSTDRVKSRIEVYRAAHQSADRMRTACNFMPVARPAHKANHLAVAQTLTPMGRIFDGLFLDNVTPSLPIGSPQFWPNGGPTIGQGGHVHEAPGQMLWSGWPLTGPFCSWYWTNMRDWMVDLRTAFHALTPPRKVVANTAAYWYEDLLDYPMVDRVYHEGLVNIAQTETSIAELVRRHAKAATKDVGLCFAANSKLGTPALSYDEISYAAMCLYLVVMDRDMKCSSYWMQEWTGPNNANYTKRAISAAETTVRAHLGGLPTGDPFIAYTGFIAAPSGSPLIPYEIWGRMFPKGVVYVRPLDRWDMHTDRLVPIPRGPQMQYVTPTGTLGTPPSVSLSCGGGAIFITP